MMIFWDDNDNALFILINDVRQSLFSFDKLSRNYLVLEVATAVECQISLIIIKVYKPFSDDGHKI